VSGRRRQGRIADVSKASRFIPSSNDPHSGALRPIVVVPSSSVEDRLKQAVRRNQALAMPVLTLGAEHAAKTGRSRRCDHQPLYRQE
jgi:hypothetical protein